MSQSDVVLLERTKGQYPLSIATSLALESLMGIHPDIEHQVNPYGQMNRFWINIRTLYRNILGACPNDLVSKLSSRSVANVVLEEMEFISDLMNQNKKIDVQFYYCNYRNLEKQFPFASIRQDRTPKQREATLAQIEVMEEVLRVIKPYKTKENPIVHLFETTLSSPYSDTAHTVFLTHLPIDLVAAPKFGDAHLIESHTGHYKPRAQWFTKYLDGNELPMIPFNGVFLQVFGDKYMFSPFVKKSRMDIIEIAKKLKWTPVSTPALLRFGIQDLLDPYLKEILMTMF